MFLNHRKKKKETQINVEKTVTELKEKYNLECQTTYEIQELGKDLKVGEIYELEDPKSYGPYIEMVVDHVDVVYTTEREPKWVEGDKEYEFEYEDKHRYKISKIQYECHNYGGIREPKYNIGIFVYLQQIEEGSVKYNVPEDKILKMSYELQTDRRGKYKVWKGNTTKSYNEFIRQFKKPTATKSGATRKRLRFSISPSVKNTRIGGKKTRKFHRKKQKKSRGGMKVEDKEFFKKKREKIEEEIGKANLFGYRQSPERDRRKMIPVDPQGIKPFQLKFKNEIEDEGNYMDAEEAGLTFN